MGRKTGNKSSGGTDDAGAIDILNLELSSLGTDRNIIPPSTSESTLTDGTAVTVYTFENAVENFELSLFLSDLGAEGEFAFESVVPPENTGYIVFDLSSLDLTARYLPAGSPWSISDGTPVISLNSEDPEVETEVETIEYGLSSDELRELQIPEFTIILKDQDPSSAGIQFGGLTIDTSNPTNINSTSNIEEIIDTFEVLFDAPDFEYPFARLNAYSSSEEDTILGVEKELSLGTDSFPTFSLVLEAEDLTLNNYFIEEYKGGGQVISRQDAPGDSGTASLLGGTHNLSGVYDLEISYFDEKDGDAELEVLINDTVVGRRILSENTTSKLPTEYNRREFLIKNLEIDPSNTLTIRGTDDGTEWARVDFLELSSNSSSLETEIFFPPDGETEDQIIRVVGEDSESATLSSPNHDLSGIYDLEIDYLDLDGEAQLEVLVNGDRQQTVTIDSASSENGSVIFDDIQINPDDNLTIKGSDVTPELSERVNIKNVTISASPVIIEAENLITPDNSSYLVEDYQGGGQLISRQDASGNEGLVSFDAGDYNLFGTFDIGISYFDENDGEAQIEVLVDDRVVGTKSLIEATDSGLPNENNRREYIIEDVEISQFSSSSDFTSPDIITIRGIDDNSEWARIDNITFYTSDVDTDFNTFDSLSLPDI